MALVSCPECQKEVSTHALACPQCALPFPGKQARGVGQAGTKLHACPDCGCSVSKRAQTCPHCGVTLMGEQTHQTTNGNTIEETWLCTHCGTPYTRKVRQEKELLTDHRAAVPTSNTGHSVERLLDQRVVHQETVVPTSNTGHSVERLLDQRVVHQETVVPASKAGHGMEGPLEPVAHQEAVVPASKVGRSVERPLEAVAHQEAVVPANKAGGSMERPLEAGAHQEAVVPASKVGRSVERPLGSLPNQVKRGNVSASPRGRSQLWQDSSFGEEIESFLPRYPRSRKKSILLGLLIFILIAASVVSGALWQLQGINPLEILVYWRM